MTVRQLQMFSFLLHKLSRFILTCHLAELSHDSLMYCIEYGTVSKLSFFQIWTTVKYLLLRGGGRGILGHAINYDQGICLFICLFNFLLFQISFATLEENYLYQYKLSSKIPHTEVFKDCFLMLRIQAVVSIFTMEN